MATAELAITLPAVVMMLLAVLLAGGAMRIQMQVTAAAGAGARAIARGQDAASAESIARELLGGAGNIEFSGQGGRVRCQVSRPLPAPLGWALPPAQASFVLPSELP